RQATEPYTSLFRFRRCGESSQRGQTQASKDSTTGESWESRAYREARSCNLRLQPSWTAIRSRFTRDLQPSTFNLQLCNCNCATCNDHGHVMLVGLLFIKLVAPVSKRTTTVLVAPPFMLAGIGKLNPCSPLSPRNAPTSGRDALAWSVAIRTPL